MSGDDSQEISEEELARIVSGAVNASASSGVRRVSSSTGAPVTLSDAAESVRAENAALEIEIAKLERNNSEKKAAIAKAEGDSRREIGESSSSLPPVFGANNLRDQKKKKKREGPEIDRTDLG